MQNREKIGRLESLLARIQQRAAEPRVAPSRRVPEPAHAHVHEREREHEHDQPPVRETIPEMLVAAKLPEPVVEPVVELAPVVVPEPIPQRITEPEVEVSELEEVHAAEELEQPPVTVGAHVPEYREAPRDDEPFVEAVSGEFAVAEVAMELEELGPADEDELVQIQVEEPKTAEPPDAEEARADEALAEAARAEEARLEEARGDRVSEPPESGRELVAAPHESARMAVAAPATPDPNALELLTEELQEPLIEDRGPPESARNLKIAPAQPQTSDVFDLEPPARIEPEPVPFAPEKLVDVIRPAVMAADVAAFIEAARDPRPETFGILLDAALDL